MNEHSVLGPIDPQLGARRPPSLMKVVADKPVPENRQPGIDPGRCRRKAIAQV
jgi:hypothetical protein